MVVSEREAFDGSKEWFDPSNGRRSESEDEGKGEYWVRGGKIKGRRSEYRFQSSGGRADAGA